MEVTGKAVGAAVDFDTGHIRITFDINETEKAKTEYEKIKDCEKLKIKAVRYTRRRSLDANAYFHVLVGKIAEALTISKARAKNLMICRYGQPHVLPSGEPLIYKTNAPESYMYELETKLLSMTTMPRSTWYTEAHIHTIPMRCLSLSTAP